MTLTRIFGLWWPLACSWGLMAAELPAFGAIVARMPEPDVNLAAFGSIVFPLALLVEAPIIMLLAAGTALGRDWQGYCRVRTFMMTAGAILTAVHALIAFSPIYWFVAETLVKAPPETLVPARLGLQIMTPWTWAIAYRRFQQGVLIAAGDSRAVFQGTVVRLIANGSVLFGGYFYGKLPGIAAGSMAIAVGVIAEAAFAGWRVRPVVRRLQGAAGTAEPLTWRAFFAFYVPLGVTPLMTLLAQPIGAAAMNRMPEALATLAIWTPVYSFIFLTRTPGFAFNEVVVALAGEPGARTAIRKFALRMAAITCGVLALLAFTPLSALWFGEVQALEGRLLDLATSALPFAILMPGYAVLQNWLQGLLVYERRTTPITEAVAIYLVASAVCLAVGVYVLEFPGVYVAICSFTIAGVLQTFWVGYRGR